MGSWRQCGFEGNERGIRSEAITDKSDMKGLLVNSVRGGKKKWRGRRDGAGLKEQNRIRFVNL